MGEDESVQPGREIQLAILSGSGVCFALEREMAQLSMELCDDGRLVYIEEATHWVQHDAADQVNTLMGDFLK